MDFSLTGEQVLIRETARSLFAGECPLDLLHRAWHDPAAAVPLWENHLREWAGLAEQPLADIALFMEEHGRACAPGVFFPTLLATLAAAVVDEAPAGSATLAVSGDSGLWTPHGEPAKHFVPCAGGVDQIVVVAGSPAAPRLAIVDAGEFSCAPMAAQMDGLRPQYSVIADSVDAGRPVQPDAWQQVVRGALVCASAELVGVGRYLLDSALAYAKERQQFGRPIGSFQGLQWKLVDASIELERAAAAVAYAAMCCDAGDPDAPAAVHGAKLEAGRAARHCARTSIQVHGGIGYTWEHGLHYWLRRAYAADAFMGAADYHAGCLAETLFAA